ncbi:MAG: hypothetical protein HN392_06335 [Anaerolineae bacterium]|nr:hypothetical protein [Anaerolineae bacterium]MBT7073722.1 hypothetical protein [Anaerolineae bacterium]MBT7782640.1 hypothetical protein [Anaerolineae bacterium]
MKFKTNRLILIGIAILILSSLTACSGADEHIWLKSPGWSRAVLLGNTVLSDPVPMTLDEDGNTYFLLFSENEIQSRKIFSVIALDPKGLALWTRPLEEIFISRPSFVQLINEKGGLELFWVDKESLYTFSLDLQGEPLSDKPILLSDNIVVEDYAIAKDDSGATTLWFGGPRKNPGMYALSTFDGKGEITSITPDGIRPQLRYDQENILHATWIEYPLGYGDTKIIYAKSPSFAPEMVQEFSVGPSSGLDGPTMGIDSKEVYLFWTITIRSGLEAGTIRTKTTHFPLGRAELASEAVLLAMPSIYGLQFEYLSNSPLDAGERVSLASGNLPKSVKVQEIITNPAQVDELAIIFRSPTEHLWRKVKEQVNMAYFYEGELLSYQPLSFTTTLSTSPNLLNSPDRHLYAVWLEKIENEFYSVYFASTSPEIEETMSRSTGRELGRIATQVSFGMLVGILMAPIAAGVWVVVPLGILFLFSPLRKIGSRRTQDILGVISLVFALIAFWFGKLAMLPGMMDYVPFSAWLPEIPELIANILRWAVPIINGLIAIFVAWFYTYRESNKSTLYFLLIYVGVDSLLTTAIYAVLIYGTI